MTVLGTHALCRRCGHTEVFIKLVPDYGTHTLLCIVTFGLWLPVLLITAFYNHFILGWRCERCGTKL